MAESNQSEEMARAADRFAEAAQELTGALNRFLDFQQSLYQWRGEDYRTWAGNQPMPRRGMLSEEDAVVLALRTEQEVREEKAQAVEWDKEERLPTPTPEEVRRRREDRRRREAEEEKS